MANLWTTDIDGERWLINPQLIVANPGRRSRKMAARRKRRMPEGLRRYWAKHRAKSNPHRRRRRSHLRNRRHHRRAKRNWITTAPVMNPRRRHRRRHAMHNRRHHRRHHYMRNPQLMGIELPSLADVAFVGAGLVVPPIVSSYVMTNFLSSYSTNTAVVWTVNIASAIAPALLVRKFVSRRAGNMMLVGGAAALALQAVKTFFPGVIPGLSGQPFLGAYVPSYQLPRRNPLMLGRYMHGGTMMSNPVYNTTPERLLPENRF
jgi:hypothetical protein